MEIKIAFLQLLPGKNLEENLETGRKACREAKEKGADVALFPEMWSDGYFIPQDEEELRKLAVGKDRGIPRPRGGARDGHRDHVPGIA